MTSDLSERTADCLLTEGGATDELRASALILLLRQTVTHAHNSTSYYRTLGETKALRPEALHSFDDLRRYPVIGKADIRDGTRFLSQAHPAEYIAFTTGTTSEPLCVYKSLREIAAIQELVAPTEGAKRPIMISVSGGNRRASMHLHDAASTSRAIRVSISTIRALSPWFDHYDNLIQILSGRYHLDGTCSCPNVMHVTPPWLAALVTDELIRRGVEPREFNLGGILVSGDFLPRALKSRLSNEWNAPVWANFSCTEIAGAAREDPEHHGVFLRPPHMVWEVIDADSGAPVGQGEAGLLVMTPLYPYQCTMALLRYSTGDVVQAIEADDGFASKIRPIGRITNCLGIGHRAFVGARDILEAVAGCPSIPQAPQPKFNFSLEESGQRIHLSIESYRTDVSTAEMLGSQFDQAITEYGYPIKLAPTKTTLHRKGELTTTIRLSPDR